VTALSIHVQPSPVGDLLIAATPDGVCAVSWSEHAAVRTRLAERWGRAGPSERARAVGRQLDEFFSGTRRRFDVALDLSLVGSFRRHVLERLATVPYGMLTSYGDLARAVGSGPRAVGGALGANPVAVIVPCHRVIAADGSLGGFGGGLERKRRLLALEGHDDFRA
jgi:methylated-DNA-[protein]-cysteine S-methyltransferase